MSEYSLNEFELKKVLDKYDEILSRWDSHIEINNEDDLGRFLKELDEKHLSKKEEEEEIGVQFYEVCKRLCHYFYLIKDCISEMKDSNLESLVSNKIEIIINDLANCKISTTLLLDDFINIHKTYKSFNSEASKYFLKAMVYAKFAYRHSKILSKLYKRLMNI